MHIHAADTFNSQLHSTVRCINTALQSTSNMHPKKEVHKHNTKKNMFLGNSINHMYTVIDNQEYMTKHKRFSFCLVFGSLYQMMLMTIIIIIITTLPSVFMVL